MAIERLWSSICTSSRATPAAAHDRILVNFTFFSGNDKGRDSAPFRSLDKARVAYKSTVVPEYLV